jgi:hypothetical protein
MEQTQNPNFVYLQDFYQLEADYHWTDDYDLTNMGRLIEYITYYHGPYRIYIIACQILRHSCEYILLDLATLLTIRRYSYLYAGTMEIVRVIMANPNLLANVRLGGREHPTIHWNIERLLRANPVLTTKRALAVVSQGSLWSPTQFAQNAMSNLLCLTESL